MHKTAYHLLDAPVLAVYTQFMQTMDILWQQYQMGGWAAVKAVPLTDAEQIFYAALMAWAEQRLDESLALAQQAAHMAPESAVYRHAVRYLQRVAQQGKAAVYVQAEGYSAFIRGGSNVALYQATSQALRQAYEETPAESQINLLDVGVGDGLALLPALTHAVQSIQLVEPAEGLLKTAEAALGDRGVQASAFCGGIQQFIQWPQPVWDIAQATYSLQSVHPDERPAVFAWLRAHCRRFLLVEFDVPAFVRALEPHFVAYVTAKFERGLAEYADQDELVGQGFLLPVMMGYFDLSASRTNYEQPIPVWAEGLRQAGFTSVNIRPLYTYWWATTCLVDARA